MANLLRSKALFYLRVLWFSAHVYATYPWEVVALLARRILEVGLLLVFWHVVQQDQGLADPRNFPAYILIASSVQYLTIGHNFRLGGNIADGIKDGSISNILLRPMSTMNYYVAFTLGRQIVVQGFAFINIIAGCILLSGIGLDRLALFALSFVVAWFLGVYCNIVVAAIGFWITEHGSFRLMLYFGLRIVSGFFVPLTFFPSVIEKVLLALPFAHFAFVPGEILTGTMSVSSLFGLVMLGIVWVVVMRQAALYIWERGRRQNDAIGI